MRIDDALWVWVKCAMRYYSGLRDVLTSNEAVKWACQNAIGVILPLIFVVVRSITFTEACEASVFYGVSSQAFSVDRSIGGRLFGGLVWIAVTLTGGLLGFAIVSISWLARGSSVPLDGLSGLDNGVDSDATLSSGFWILLMVLHVVVSIFLMYTRAITPGLDLLHANICQIYVSVVTLVGMGLMPSLGQYEFWTQGYSPFLKINGIVLLSMVVNCTMVYVKSSHDQVREQMGDIFVEMGKLFTKLSSGFHMASTSKDPNIDIDRWKNDIISQRYVKTPREIMRMSLGAQISNSMCALEPPWPMLCSQVGANRFKYAKAIKKVQVFLGTLKEFETMAYLLLDNVAKRNSSISDTETLIFDVASEVSAMMASVLASMEVPLKHMPLWGPCSGDVLSWRPHSLKFWDTQMKAVSDCIKQTLSLLRESAFTGITKALQAEPLEAGDQRGVGIAMLASFESMIDELISIEITVSQALDITDADIYSLVEDNNADSPGDFSCQASTWKTIYNAVWTHPHTSAPLRIFCDASGLHIWNLQRKAIAQLLCNVWDFIRGANIDQKAKDLVLASESRRQHQLYIKAFVAYNLAVVGIILIGWYCYANTGSYITDASGVARWFTDWQPYYFVLAVAICTQDTVDASFIKAILRASLIAIGGSLGYAASVNGSLMQNPYFVTMITILVNGFAGLFSPISFDYRYSLFLFVYTFNGVFVCSYTGICCTPGDVQTFGGKAVSTALGAIYAFIVSNIVFPSYSSEVAFELEGYLLQSFMHSIQTCFWKGSDMLSKQQQDVDSTNDSSQHMDAPYAYIGISTGDHKEWNAHILETIATRLGIISRIYKEVETRAFDRHYMFFLRITLIPLPRSLKLVYQDVIRIGSYVAIAGRVVRSSFLRGGSSIISHQLKARMFEPTDACLYAASDVCQALIQIFVRKRVRNEDITILKNKLAVLEEERRRLFDLYVETLPLLRTTTDLSYCDLRYLLWYGMLTRSIREVSCLATSMANIESYRDKGHHWIFPSIQSGSA